MKRKITTAISILLIIASMFITGCGSKAATGQPNKSIKKYTISTDATYAPFEFEKDNKYVGIDIDLLNEISKLEGFEYELKPMDFKGIIPALTSNQIDGAIAGITITDERKQALDFSDGYFESGLSLVVSKDNNSIKSVDDLMGKKVAIKKGTAGATFAEENKDKYKLSIKYFDDTPSMFQEVVNGNADATFEDYPVIAYEVSVDPNSKLKIAVDKIYKAYYGFTVKKGSNKELIDMFNDGLKKLKDNGEYDKIVKKYIK
ncbi:MAG TPA: glutamine ABC transporter substrate-binding protein [Clostridiaceae bacterium]|nr:glutamine ABC transporter substrate-binding protein [Clostridiaceae bacterium]